MILSAARSKSLTKEYHAFPLLLAIDLSKLQAPYSGD